MREIVLDQRFVNEVRVLEPQRNIPSVVQSLARALDELPVDMAEDIIYHSLVTSALGGKQLDQEQLVLSLLELCRIRAEKGDGFNALPTAKWSYLHYTSEYQTVAKMVKCPLEMGMVLHTISGYLKEMPANFIDEMVRKLEDLKKQLKSIRKTRNSSTTTLKQIEERFYHEFIDIGSVYVEREKYLLSLADEFESFYEAFANLFIMMANEPLVYV